MEITSLPLATSNLTNIISADLFGPPFAWWVAIMEPVNMVGVTVSLGVLWLMFRHSWPAICVLSALPLPQSALLAPTPAERALG
ncbi:ArsB/NhaD family transporter [Deinococcus alpinitundrae]|uniref:ArsB/NhaD family transporter n=1 Tax=Deinococcus alpinitundrae TaxID=468913 RepID=UPI00137B0E36|nr:ArsB/NhaD family transporter [Deinococcus alpinitundrae]